MKSRAGFTLIELIIVIIILGILAVSAAPRFINLSQDARIATLESLQGALKSGESMVLATANIPNRIVEDGGNRYVDMNGDGVADVTPRTPTRASGRLGAPAPAPIALAQDGKDIRLTNTNRIANDDIAKVAELDGLDTQVLGGNSYIGYDLDDDGDVIEHNCHILYNATSGFSLVSSGC